LSEEEKETKEDESIAQESQDGQEAQEPEGRDEIQEKDLPIDARLLSEAIIELNISRRSVGLYPAGHKRISKSIERAFDFLEKLFEMRSSITLGITKDSLIIDNNIMDSGNPIYQDCANSFHNVGLASLTFNSGMNREELIHLHELMSMKDPPLGQDFVDQAELMEIRRVKLIPIDYTSFKFVEGSFRAGTSSKDLWEDYVYGLLEGTLSGGEMEEGAMLKVSPERVADYINKVETEEKGGGKKSYDNFISSYLRDGGEKLSSKSINKLVDLMKHLTPEIKEQFLSRTAEHLGGDLKKADSVLKDMNSNDLKKVSDFFNQSSDKIPSSMKNIIDKFSSLRQKQEKDYTFDISTDSSAIIHDIEISDEVSELFDDDHFEDFVSDAYMNELEAMMSGNVSMIKEQIAELEQQMHNDMVDRVTSEIMLEVLDFSEMKTEEYLAIVTNLTNMASDFVETGRFEDTLNIYNSLYSQSLTGAFAETARGTLEYFFRSEEFLAKIMRSASVWGRSNRKELVRLIKALKHYLIVPLLDALVQENNASRRKFLLAVLGEIGTEVLPEVLKLLNDPRWYVVRNMLLLIRLCNGKSSEDKVRPLAKHKDARIWAEAIKTLIAFKSPYAIPLLRGYVLNEDPEIREVAVQIAGAYKVKTLVPELINIIDKKDIIGSGAFYKISAVKALGDIADPKAIEFLEKAVKAKGLWYKEYRDELRSEIFKTLHRYPKKSVIPLLQWGEKSGDQQIKELSAKLLKNILGGGPNG
jgi:hypothetical protein